METRGLRLDNVTVCTNDCRSTTSKKSQFYVEFPWRRLSLNQCKYLNTHMSRNRNTGRFLCAIFGLSCLPQSEMRLSVGRIWIIAVAIFKSLILLCDVQFWSRWIFKSKLPLIRTQTRWFSVCVCVYANVLYCSYIWVDNNLIRGNSVY